MMKTTQSQAPRTHTLLAQMGYSVSKIQDNGLTWFDAYLDGSLIADGLDTAKQAWACAERYDNEEM